MILDFIGKNIEFISDNFVFFFILSALIIVCTSPVAYTIARSHFSGQISTLKEQIKYQQTKLDDYEKNLDVSSPDEALEMIQSLERRVAGLEPTALNDSQRERLLAALSVSPGKVVITNDSASYKASNLNRQLCPIFDEAGWKVGSGTHHGSRNFNPTGILIRSVSGSHAAAIIYAAFIGIGLKPELEEMERSLDIHEVSIYLSDPQ